MKPSGVGVQIRAAADTSISFPSIKSFLGCFHYCQPSRDTKAAVYLLIKIQRGELLF